MHALSRQVVIRLFSAAVSSCSTDALAHPALESYFVGPFFAAVLSDYGEISQFGLCFPGNLRGVLRRLLRRPLIDFDDLKNPIPSLEHSAMPEQPDSSVDVADDEEIDPSLLEAFQASQKRTQRRNSVLREVQQRTAQKTRRRKPPTWAMKIAAAFQASQRFVRITVPQWLKSHREEIKTAAISTAVHVLVLLVMASLLLPGPSEDVELQLIVNNDKDDLVEQPVELAEIVQPKEIVDLNVNSTMQQMLAELDKGQHRMQVDSNEQKELTLPLEEFVDISDIPFVKGHFGGRSDAGRRAAVSLYGGNAESEQAVSLGLKWLASIQRVDGSWSFGAAGDPVEPGDLTTTDMGATSMALLCFLGAGHTHMKVGPYKDNVLKGLNYLYQNAERGAMGADLRARSQGNSGMYVQGIAAICLCEAAAMEKDDKELRKLAGEAIKFIEKAQNRIDGGWRYRIGEAGDTSVVGWQVMALQSAKAGQIKVQSDTILDVKGFLKSVQSFDGAQYGYKPGDGPRDSMTAVGLLCRMYLGWKRENPALKAGVEHLSRVGPQPGRIYYNYYATQVLHHWGGELWNQWNLKMRDELVSTQVKSGPGAGSWDFRDDHGSQAGRLYQTTLSLLTLEVYYRHLPIYQRFDENESAAAAIPEKAKGN